MRIRSIWVAWGLLILGLLGNGAGLALSAANGDLSWHAGEALLWVVFPAFLVVGCLILARRPGNIIGWIFTAVGLLTTTADLAEPYATYAYAHPGTLPVPLLAAWVNAWIWPPTIMLTVVLPLLVFPTGRSLSPRWRLVTWLAVGLVVAYTVSGALNPSLQLDGRAIANPIGVAGMGWTVDSLVLSSAICCCWSSRRRSSRWWCASAARGGWNASSSSGSPTPAPWCWWPR